MAQEKIGQMVPSLKNLFGGDDGLRQWLEAVVQQALSVEVSEHLNAARHERSEGRVGYRNGSKPRALRTRVGEMELSVPQVRGCEPYHPSMFHRWQRCERALLVACGEMYFQGVSTRNVRRVLEAMCDGEVSAARR